MQEQTRSADEMFKILVKKPDLLDALKANPLPVLEEARDEAVSKTTPAYIGDKVIYRGVVLVLGLVVLIATVGYIILANQKIPEALVAIGSAAIGALAGLLAPSPTSK